VPHSVDKALYPKLCRLALFASCRYVFYVREQQQLALLQASAGQSTDSAVDLVGYVEFQRNFK